MNILPVGIRWESVGAAMRWYREWGFRYVEAPWIVTERAVGATLPPGKSGYYLGHPEYSPGYLVGSAEQAFLQMMIDGQLRPGKYFAAGPCFRDDPIDDLHSRHFFKVELIEVIDDLQTFSDVDDMSVYNLMAVCKRFFEDHTGLETKVVPTGHMTYDLELAGIEIGSYGLRSYGKHRWIYGTGLALPRLDIAIKRCDTPSADRR